MAVSSITTSVLFFFFFSFLAFPLFYFIGNHPCIVLGSVVVPSIQRRCNVMTLKLIGVDNLSMVC